MEIAYFEKDYGFKGKNLINDFLLINNFIISNEFKILNGEGDF